MSLHTRTPSPWNVRCSRRRPKSACSRGKNRRSGFRSRCARFTRSCARIGLRRRRRSSVARERRLTKKSRTAMKLKHAFVAALGCALAIGVWAQAPVSYDVIIRGGRIVDGTGNPWTTGDVAIKGGRIAAVGSLRGATAPRVVDATGLVVAPGFIDLHTHSDTSLLADPYAQSKVRQGVTIDVVGESTSVAPRDGLPNEDANDGAGAVTQDWTTFTDYFTRLERERVSMNVISHVSATHVRRGVMGYDSRAATPAEIDRMKRLVARSMEEGAWGLVTRYESGGP